MIEPIRTCAGCGRRAAKEDLHRFVERDGRLTPADRSSLGRGVYTCRRLQCFDRASSTRAFARALRRTVIVDRSLVGLYTEGHG